MMPGEEPRRGRAVRCAVYTRKSSEEGLEQDFNSLHAQREACDAFIKSQKHEGWLCLPHAYDDGGISGGTMDRPALRQLLTDIRAGNVDVVVVYKVDRLTRSLADFAKIVEIFDAHEVSFVSVTQQFNTTSSMGRLTLNVLLSFAQFEREMTQERIRDKIAASKKKGMWMGGIPPLGYDVRDRKLVPNETEAATVRVIFQRYLELGSVRLLQQDLEARGIVAKVHERHKERRGGRPMQRGTLYHLLQNRLYLGEVVHKGLAYPGQHPAIVEQDAWERAQTLLQDHATERRIGARCKDPSLLTGLIYDGAGHRMTPSHAVKDGKRFRYYVSRPLTANEQRLPTDLRTPALEVERVVIDRIRSIFATPSMLLEVLGTTDAVDTQALLSSALSLSKEWASYPVGRIKHLVRNALVRLDVDRESIVIHLSPDRMRATLTTTSATNPIEDAKTSPFLMTIPMKAMRVGFGTRLVIDSPNRPKRAPDKRLVRLLAQAQSLYLRVTSSKATMIEVAAEANITSSYAARLVRLAWLAPDIVEAILDGSQPQTLSARRLMNDDVLPADWSDQRRLLGFA